MLKELINAIEINAKGYFISLAVLILLANLAMAIHQTWSAYWSFMSILFCASMLFVGELTVLFLLGVGKN